MSEDCLVLNIWTPALRDRRKRPVMMWIHGGSFSTGSGASPVYDGTNLSRKGDVVVVTVNHRLNVFGHLYLARLGGTEYAESGNIGVLDLVAAMKWVHINIAEFGGDPANVTLFGQGGGGAKISVLMAMPQTRGLFHRAIIQSCSWSGGVSAEEANATAQILLKVADVPNNDLARLQRLAPDQLLMAMRQLTRTATSRPRFGPVVDGRFLPKPAWVSEAPANSATIPMIVGTTASETTAVVATHDAAVFGLDDTGLRNKLSGWVPPAEIERVVVGYRKLLPDAAPSDLYFAITSTRAFRQQAWLQAERKSGLGAAPVWLYELDWRTPVEGGKWRSPHSLDLAFVFDNVAKSEAVVGHGEEPRLLAEQMSSAWLAFARTGNPNNRNTPQWPAFQVPGRATMLLDARSRLESDFRGGERQLLASLPAYKPFE